MKKDKKIFAPISFVTHAVIKKRIQFDFIQ